MWQHTLIVVLAFTTAIPTQVVQAGITVEQVKKIVDDILAKLETYGPTIIKFIAPFVAKKLVEIGVIKLGSLAVESIGKRDVTDDEQVVVEAEKYLLAKYNEMVHTLREEFHKKIDTKAINDEIEDWKEFVAELANEAKDRLQAFIGEVAQFDFKGYVKSVLDWFVDKSVSKRSVIRTNLDQDALNKYGEMLGELKEVLEKKFGHQQKRSVIRTNLDQDALNKYDEMLGELKEVLEKKFGGS